MSKKFRCHSSFLCSCFSLEFDRCSFAVDVMPGRKLLEATEAILKYWLMENGNKSIPGTFSWLSSHTHSLTCFVYLNGFIWSDLYYIDPLGNGRLSQPYGLVSMAPMFLLLPSPSIYLAYFSVCALPGFDKLF